MDPIDQYLLNVIADSAAHAKRIYEINARMGASREKDAKDE